MLTREVLAALKRLNPNLPDAAYDDALSQVVQDDITKSLIAKNEEKYKLLRDGVPVQFKDKTGRRVDKRLRLIDFDKPDNNRYHAVRELWVRGRLWLRRPDVIGFVNGLPLVFIELKRFEAHIDTIAHLFHWNALVVISNGHDAQYGSLTSTKEYFYRWKRLDEDDAEPAKGKPLLPLLLEGMLHRQRLFEAAEKQLTREVFGDYVSIYDFQRAVADGATLPLFYENAGEKLKIVDPKVSERINQHIEAAKQAATLDDPWTDEKEDKLYRELARDYPILTSPTRLEKVATDSVEHYHQRWRVVENGGGKALMVCLDKITCVKMHDLIAAKWREKADQLHQAVLADEVLFASKNKPFTPLLKQRRAQVDWMRETEICVVVSQEQGEVAEFAKWKNFRDEPLDIKPHREKMVKRDLEKEFKKADNPFRVAIVCAMWLTGFDVKSLATLYLDKPMQGHTLMQAIARVNRVGGGKKHGPIIDYNGMIRSLRRALATFAQGDRAGTGKGEAEQDTVRDDAKALAEYAFTRLRAEFEKTPFKNVVAMNLMEKIEERLAALVKANPTRVDLYERYQEIVQAYNKDKDAAEIQKVMDDLFAFNNSCSEEERRYLCEGLENEQQLAVFDLLQKDALTKKDRARGHQAGGEGTAGETELGQAANRPLAREGHGAGAGEGRDHQTFVRQSSHRSLRRRRDQSEGRRGVRAHLHIRPRRRCAGVSLIVAPGWKVNEADLPQ